MAPLLRNRTRASSRLRSTGRRTGQGRAALPEPEALARKGFFGVLFSLPLRAARSSAFLLKCKRYYYNMVCYFLRRPCRRRRPPPRAERSVSAVTRERAFRRQSTDHRVKAVAHESMTTAVLAFASGPCKVPVSGLESSLQKLEHEHHGRDVVTRAAAQRPAH